MTSRNTIKANEQPLLVNEHRNERNSLVTMLAEGRRLVIRRNSRDKDKGYTQLYPPMDAHFQPVSVQHRERGNQNSLDTTFHATSHMLEEALSIPIVDRVGCHSHKSGNALFIAKGTSIPKLANSIKHQSYTSIDISNVSNTDNNIDWNSSAYVLCFNISKNCSQLQSLCLHNCKIDDECVKALISILTKANMLRSLNLSRNIVTDIGAKALLEAMKSEHCFVEEFDLSQNQLTLTGITSFAEDLSNLLYLKNLRLADSEHLIPVSIYQQFAAAIESNVVIQTLTLGSEIMDCTLDETDEQFIAIDKKQRIDDVLLCFWHEPQYTTVTGHIRTLLQQNYSGIGELICASQIDVTAIRDMLDALQPEQELDACFRMLRLRPDILLAIV